MKNMHTEVGMLLSVLHTEVGMYTQSPECIHMHLYKSLIVIYKTKL